MLNKTLTVAALFVATSAYAEDVPITGEVQSKCSIYTTTQGVFGTPSINELSTLGADGGVNPILRVDTSQAGYYIAKMFSRSWSGRKRNCARQKSQNRAQTEAT